MASRWYLLRSRWCQKRIMDYQFWRPLSKRVRNLGEGGYFHQNRTRMCLPNLEYKDFLRYQRFAQLPTHQCTIYDRKTPNVAQICSKYTQFLNLVSVSDGNPLGVNPQKAGTYVYLVNTLQNCQCKSIYRFWSETLPKLYFYKPDYSIQGFQTIFLPITFNTNIASRNAKSYNILKIQIQGL